MIVAQQLQASVFYDIFFRVLLWLSLA